MARKHGCDDVIHWSRNGVEKELIKQTQDKAFNGGFDAIIDFVNTTVTAERVFKCLQQVTLQSGPIFIFIELVCVNNQRCFTIYINF